MFKFIQDPKLTPKELAFCYKELQNKEEKLINEKKLLYEQMLSLQGDIRAGKVPKPDTDSTIKKQIDEKGF